jgi:hypothetical protein
MLVSTAAFFRNVESNVRACNYRAHLGQNRGAGHEVACVLFQRELVIVVSTIELAIECQATLREASLARREEHDAKHDARWGRCFTGSNNHNRITQ